MAGWAAAWCTVLLVGMGWQAVAAPGETDYRDEPAKSSFEIARLYMTLVFEDHDFTRAEESQCDGFSGSSPKDLEDDLAEWQNSDGSLPDTKLRSFTEDEANPNLFKAVINVELDSNPQALPYSITADPTVAPPCVLSVTSG